MWRGRAGVEGEKESVHIKELSVGPRFFETRRLPVVAGRAFAPSDFESTRKAAVVNQAFVRQYLRDRNPLGLHLGESVSKDDPGEEIIAVVGDAKYDDLKKTIEPTPYFLSKAVAQY